METTKHAPDSLKYQWRLYGLVARSAWATSLDKSIAYEIIENYRKDFGNSRTSLRFLETATGATRTNIIASLRRLMDFGPFSVHRQGAGVRPTEYLLHFESLSGPLDVTSSAQVSSGIVDDTSCGPVDDTAKISSGPARNTESVLHVPAYKADVHVSENEPAARSAPPAHALGGSAAVPAGGFDALWTAYAYRRNRAAAKDAFERLAATSINMNDVSASAEAWHDAWSQQGNPDAPRYTLAKWLEQERYLEEPPKGYKTSVKQRPAAANDNQILSYRRDATGITVAKKGGGIEKITDQTRIDEVVRISEVQGVASDNGTFVVLKS